MTDAPFDPAYKAKGALKQDDLRRRREEQQVEIRRQKREENISKRRNLLPSTGADSDEEVISANFEDPVGFLVLDVLEDRSYSFLSFFC